MVANPKGRGRAAGRSGPGREKWDTAQDQLEKLMDKCPPVFHFTKGAGLWEKRTFQCAVNLGCVDSLLCSKPVSSRDAAQYVVEGKRAPTESEQEADERYIKAMGERLTSRQRQMLDHHEAGWEYIINPTAPRLENDKTKLKREVMMRWIDKSLQGSIHAGYKQHLEDFVRNDYSRVFLWVVKKSERSRQIEVGHLCRQASLHHWTPGTHVLTWKARQAEQEKEIQKIAPGITRDVEQVLMLLAAAYSDQTYTVCLENLLVEDTRAVTEYMEAREKKYDAIKDPDSVAGKAAVKKLPPPVVTFLTMDKVASRMVEIHTAKDQLRGTNAKLRSAGPGRDRAFAGTDQTGPGECFQWRDNGNCTYENCKYSHDGPRGKTPQGRTKNKPNKSGPKESCKTCGRNNHSTDQCYAGTGGKKEKVNKFKSKSNKKTNKANKAQEEKGSPRQAAKGQEEPKSKKRKRNRAFMAKWIDCDSDSEPDTTAPPTSKARVASSPSTPVAAKLPSPSKRRSATKGVLPLHKRKGFAAAGKHTRSKRTFRSLIDSGTNRNCTKDATFLTSGRKKCHTKLLGIEKPDGESMTCTLEGTMDLSIGGYSIPHKRTLYSKDMAENLSSVTEEVDQGITTIFDANGCYKVRSDTFEWVGDVLAKVDRDPADDLWYIEWDLDETGKACLAKHQAGFKKECHLRDLDGYIKPGPQTAPNPEMASKTVNKMPTDPVAEVANQKEAKPSSREQFGDTSPALSNADAQVPASKCRGTRTKIGRETPKNYARAAKSSPKPSRRNAQKRASNPESTEGARPEKATPQAGAGTSAKGPVSPPKTTKAAKRPKPDSPRPPGVRKRTRKPKKSPSRASANQQAPLAPNMVWVPNDPMRVPRGPERGKILPRNPKAAAASSNSSPKREEAEEKKMNLLRKAKAAPKQNVRVPKDQMRVPSVKAKNADPTTPPGQKTYQSEDHYVREMAKGMPKDWDSPAVARLARSYTGNAEENELWHRRLIHLHSKLVQKAKPDLAAYPEKLACDACAQAKIHAGPFNQSPSIEEDNFKPGERMDCDGKMGFVATLTGNRGRYVYVDKATGYINLGFVKTKDQQPERMKEAIEDFNSLSGRKLKLFKCDGGPEIVSKECTEILKAIPAKRKLSGPYAPASNYMAENANRNIDEPTEAQMIHAHAPSNLWAECQNHTVAVRNRAFLMREKHGKNWRATSRTNLMTGRYRDFNHNNLHVWGCRAYAYIPKKVRRDKGAQKRKCHVGVWMGLATEMEGARVLVLKSRIVVEVPYQFTIVHEDSLPFRVVPRTTLEMLLPPTFREPEDDGLEEIGQDLDPEVDIDYAVYNPEALDHYGSEDFNLNALGKTPALPAPDEEEEEEEEEQKHEERRTRGARNLGPVALNNLADGMVAYSSRAKANRQEN